MKLVIGYPTRAEERAILDAMATSEPNLRVDPVVSLEELRHARGIVNRVYVDDKIRDYIVDIVSATRTPTQYKLAIGDYLLFGAGLSRASYQP